jgi:type I restriction enzyme S subunit
MNKYKSYKPSGVEWIGEIPSHWDFIKTNILTENLDGKRVPLNSEERGEMVGEYPYWGSNGVVDYVNQFLFNEEIVLVGEDGSPFFDKLKDVSFYINEPVWVNNHIHILKPKERILPKYLTHSFNCVDYKEYITGSTRDKLTQSDLKRISHCVPPIQEQYQIVQFLDEKTKLIDTLISIKVRKITLLKEQRTSLINQVVTKGLISNVKMKDSGIEWIGKIPEDWSLKKIKHLTHISVGLVINPSSYFDDKGDIPIITGKNVKISGIDLTEVDFITKETNLILKQSMIFEGDIITMRVGYYVGRTTVVSSKEDGINCCSLIITRKSNKFNSYFLNYVFNSEIGKIQIEQSQGGMGTPVVNVGQWKEFNVTYPPVIIQDQIVEYLDSKTKEIDNLVQLEKNKIDLLKEYRQSLISEVVTGKIKVTTDE